MPFFRLVLLSDCASGFGSRAKVTTSRTIVAAILCSFFIALLVVGHASADTPVFYQVQPGDTLSDISTQFGVSVDSLVAMNALSDPGALAIGDTLILRATGSDPIADIAQPPASAVVDPITAQDADTSQILAAYGSGSTVKALAVSTSSSSQPARSLLLATPFYSQFDGSVWGQGNCGPTSLSMALGAVGIDVDQMSLRHLADNQMGMRDPYEGTTWESLAYAAHQSGASTDGLYQGNGYSVWSLDSLKSELAQGRPVVLLVRYWNLPDHGDSNYSGDHYIVALGFNVRGDLIYNDPASTDGEGLLMTPAELTQAWSHTWVGYTRTAMAVYK